MRYIIALLTALLLAACGGGAPAVPEVSRALTAAFAPSCVPADTYQTLIERGALQPLPPLPEGAIWHAPFVLLPAGEIKPIEWAPGRWATPVTVAGPDGPMRVTGPYYVPGEFPEFVCTAQ